jgi:hypothetical protein
MKKHLTVLVLALLFATLLSSAACGSDDSSPAGRDGGQEATLPSSDERPTPTPTPTPEAEDTPAIPDIPENPASEFSYKYNADIGGIEITEYKGSAIRVRVPEMIEEVPVKLIGDTSFRNSGVMEVYLPGSSIPDTSLGSNFSKCY